MKKTITAVISAIMMLAMGTTSFAAPTIPDNIIDSGWTIFDTILAICDQVLGLVGTIAGMLFK